MKATEIMAELNESRDPGDPLLTYRQLDYWCRQGLLGEEASRVTGSGRARELSDSEARQIRIMAPLISTGMTPRAASKVALQVIYMSRRAFPMGPDFMLLYQPGGETDDRS